MKTSSEFDAEPNKLSTIAGQLSTINRFRLWRTLRERLSTIYTKSGLIIPVIIGMVRRYGSSQEERKFFVATHPTFTKFARL